MNVFQFSSGAIDDIRPGLPMSLTAKRKLENYKKSEEVKKIRLDLKAKKVTAKDRLDEGLNTALSQDNKGFAMLQKMGYKPGTCLGKEGMYVLSLNIYCMYYF